MSRKHDELTPDEMDAVALNLEYQRQLAEVEADPTQRRPVKKPSVWNRVDFMDHDTYADLGVWPIALGRRHWQEQP